jgi:hypothetical protein
MISKTLRQRFEILEMAAFNIWKNSNQKKRKEICKRLGEYEARQIIKEINSKIETINKI